MIKSLPKPKDKKQFVIINLETSKEDGSHWCAFAYSTDRLEYFDSYGLYPPDEVETFAEAHNIETIYFQNEQLQKTSNRCGWFCLRFGQMVLIEHKTLKQITPKTLNEDLIRDFQASF